MPPPKDPIKYKLWNERQRKSRIGKHYSIRTEFKKGQPSTKKGIPISLEQYEKMKNSGTWFKKGQVSLFKGKKHKSESIEKNRQARIGKKLPPRTAEFREKLRIANLGKRHTPESIEKIRKAKTGRRHTPEEIAKYTAWRTTQVLPFKDTKPERMMQIALALNGIQFVKHKPFKLGRKWHQVDIFIEPNICIEVDGVHWHIYPDAIKRDLFQTQELTLMGYHVIRIREKDILKNTQNCAEKVINLIKELHYRYPFQV